MNLEEKLRKLLADAKAIVAKADSENSGIMTDEQSSAYDAIITEIESVKAAIARRDQLASIEGGLRQSTGRTAEHSSIIVGKDRIENDPKRGFASIADFSLAVKDAVNPSASGIDERLRTLAAPSGYMQGRGGDEGFEVPAEFRAAIWNAVEGDEADFDLFNVFTPEPTNSNTVEVSRDQSTPWGTSGVQAYYGPEAGQMTASQLETKKDYVPVHKLYAFVLATDELLADSPRLNNRLTTKAGEAIRYKGSSSLFAGDGVGKPLGFFNSGSLVSQAAETNQTADTINAANIAKMYSRLLGSQRGIWLIHSDAFPQIMTLSLNGNPIWTPYAEGFKYRPNGLLLGQPVFMSEHCQTVGDKGDIVFVNPRGYMHVARTGAPEFAQSMHLYFDYGMEAFRWTFRHGGQPYMNSAISPKNGSSTRSHFVTLAAR